MTDTLRNTCELFERNRAAISKKFNFEKPLMSIVAGLIFAGAGKEADVEKLAECRKILNRHTGLFSQYRETVKLALLSEMAMSGDPEQYIEDVKTACHKLRRGKLADNPYMVLAAMLLCELGRQYDADEVVEKHNEIMKRMAKQHPFLTNAEDISYVLLLAMTSRPVDSIVGDIEECMTYIKGILKRKIDADTLQGLGEILALTDGDVRGKCDRIIGLYNALDEKDANVGNGYVFSSLGILLGVDEEPETIVSELIEVDEFLKGCKGFDEKSVEKKHRLMFAEILVAESLGAGSSIISNAFINSALGIIKAQQAAAMITILSNVLPAVIGAVAERSESGEKDDSSQREQTSESGEAEG